MKSLKRSFCLHAYAKLKHVNNLKLFELLSLSEAFGFVIAKAMLLEETFEKAIALGRGLLVENNIYNLRFASI